MTGSKFVNLRVSSSQSEEPGTHGLSGEHFDGGGLGRRLAALLGPRLRQLSTRLRQIIVLRIRLRQLLTESLGRSLTTTHIPESAALFSRGTTNLVAVASTSLTACSLRRSLADQFSTAVGDRGVATRSQFLLGCGVKLCPLGRVLFVL